MNLETIDKKLDIAVVLLIKAKEKIPRRHKGKVISETHVLLDSGVIVPRDYNKHRIIYDTYDYAVADTLTSLIVEVWKKLRTTKYETGLEYMTSRTLVELGIYKTTAYFSKKDSRQEKLLTNSKMYEICAHFLSSAENGIPLAKKLLNEEKNKISKEMYDFILQQADNPSRYGKKGTFKLLTTRSQSKLLAIYKDFEKDVIKHAALSSMDIDGVYIVGSGAIHGNVIPLGTLLNKKQALKMQHMLFALLLRVAFYSAEIVAGYINNAELMSETKSEIAKINWNSLKPD